MGGFDFFARVGIATAARSQLAARARGWRWAARRCEDDRHAAPVDAMSWSADRQCGIPWTFVFYNKLLLVGYLDSPSPVP